MTHNAENMESMKAAAADAADVYAEIRAPFHERSVAEAVRRAVREAYSFGYQRGHIEATDQHHGPYRRIIEALPDSLTPTALREVHMHLSAELRDDEAAEKYHELVWAHNGRDAK